MTAVAATATGEISRAQWRVLILSSLGGALEFYDFVVFSTFAQYLSGTFFPSSDPTTGLLKTFITFAVGYIVRPVGGVVFGHFGDKFGRRPVFIIAMLLMSLATVGIGVLPGYATWGIAAPIALVLLRILQGFCLGGELPGAGASASSSVACSASSASGCDCRSRKPPNSRSCSTWPRNGRSRSC
jgi:MHS family proline/betaine transporter-like MFS transporter